MKPISLLRLIYSYILSFQLGLILVAIHLYRGNLAFENLSTDALIPKGWSDLGTLTSYGVGMGALGAALFMPTLANRAFVGYIIRLCLLEVCALAGFVLAFTNETWAPILPFSLAGLVGTLVFVPTEKVAAALGGSSTP